MTDETELKLELTMEGAALVEASSLLPGKPAWVEQYSTYFDTPNCLLFKAGLSLRIRLANGARTQTVKGDGANAAALFVRSEWERSVADDRPILDDTTPISSLLCEKVREIAPIFKVDVIRQIWIIKEGKTLIEVALDRGEVIAGDRSAPICEIEFELKSGNTSDLFAWARRIDGVTPVHLGLLSKAERGYRLRSAMPESAKAEPVTLEKKMTADVAFQKIAHSCLLQFRLNEVLIEDQNPDALHQARVGLRRLSSALTTFKPILTDEAFPVIRANIRWLAGELGRARDLDVLAARATNQELHERLETARIDAYSRIQEVLESKRARACMLDLAEWIADGRWLSQPDARFERKLASKVFAREVLHRLHKKVKKAGNLTKLGDEKLHKVRKNAKKLRYAAEFFASLYNGKDARRRHKSYINALERLQNELGVLNDFAVAPAVLARIGIENNLGSELLLSRSKKADLLIAAAKAHHDLTDAKGFWGSHCK
ncbi:MAG: CHAD domain-containing protein [Sphingorhabdus sp.]